MNLTLYKTCFAGYLRLLILFAACLLPAQGETAVAGPWMQVQTKNFQLVGNAGEQDIRRVGRRLEQFRAVFSQLFPNTRLNSPNVTRVLVFKDAKSFEPFKSHSRPGGYFQAGEDVNYVALSLDDEDYRDIFHEYTHFLIDNNIGRTSVPPWLYEGLAEFFEQYAEIGEQKIGLGGLDSAQLTLFLQYKLIPFDALSKVDYYTLHRQKKENARLFGAQALATVHLLRQAEKDFARFEQLTGLLARGRPANEALRHVFQIEPDSLDAELRTAEAKRFAPVVVDVTGNSAFAGETRAQPLADSEAKALLADLLYRLDRLPEAERLAAEALRANPKSGPAHIALGLVRMRERNFVEALTLLERAVQLEPRDYRAHFNLALVQSREEMTGYGFVAGYSAAQAEKIRASLRRAIELEPDFAESYQLLALVNFVRNEMVDDGLAKIEKALKIAPGNPWYLLRRAQLLMRREDFMKARQITHKVIPTASDDALKVYAENTVTVIDSLEAQLLSIKFGRYKNVDDLVTDKPVSEEELRRRRERALIESLNRALRMPDFNETRLLGFVTGIDCSGGGIVVAVKTDAGNLHFRADSLSSVMLMAFEGELANSEIDCGPLRREGFSVITYRPAADPRSKIHGELISIEFVPRNFRFLDRIR